MNLTKITAGLVSGLLFGAGLAISGMTNPNKVLNFLDVTGSWDPTLALVMAAAVPVSALSFWLAGRRNRPLLEHEAETGGEQHGDRGDKRHGSNTRLKRRVFQPVSSGARVAHVA